MKIIARDRKGVEHVLEGNEGWTVMEALRDAGLPITAECGGACACATCHVYVEDGWYEKLRPPSPEETDMLDMALAVGHLRRMRRPHAGIAIGLQLERDGIAIRFGAARGALLGSARGIAGAEQLLHVMAHLMRDHIGLRKIARCAEA